MANEELKNRFNCFFHSCAGDFCCYNSWTEVCIYPKCVDERVKWGKHFCEKKE